MITNYKLMVKRRYRITVTSGEEGLGNGLTAMISVVDSLSDVAEAARNDASFRALEGNKR